MATAGRILIIPRGGYSSTTQYKPLDLVLYNGDSWLCKQDTKGIEPSDANSAYWYRFTDNQTAIANIESSILDTIAEVEANEEEKKIAGALAVKELSAKSVKRNDIVDNLSSTYADLPLSANQGKILNDKVEQAKAGIPTITLDEVNQIAYIVTNQA